MANKHILNLKSPSHERQNSSHGLGMTGRSHLGIAPAYMVVLKELNMRCSALMYSCVSSGMSSSKQPSRHSYKMVAIPAKSKKRNKVLHCSIVLWKQLKHDFDTYHFCLDSQQRSSEGFLNLIRTRRYVSLNFWFLSLEKQSFRRIITNLPWHIWRRGRSHCRQCLCRVAGSEVIQFSSPGRLQPCSRHLRRRPRPADAWWAVWARCASSSNLHFHWKKNPKSRRMTH